MHAMQKWLGLQNNSAPSKIRTHAASRLTATRLNHWAIDLYRYQEKKGTWIISSQNLELLFCFQHCLARIANVEYQGQTRYTGILEHKPLICTMCTSFAFDKLTLIGFMYMKNLVKSYLKWCLTRFQMNIWRRITWKLWKVTYSLSRIPAFVGINKANVCDIQDRWIQDITYSLSRIPAFVGNQ